MRTVIFSHAHPTFSKGGGEFAAYYLFKGLNALPNHEAWFIGRADNKLMHSFTSLACIDQNEYLISGEANIEQLTATTPLHEDADLAQLLKKINPDVVHFHHYVHVGIELIRLVKKTCPKTKIFVTLHEYIAICNNNGQMVKTNGRLCYQYSPRECSLCFPHKKPEDFFLRERYIKSFFNLVDTFISPSQFLKDRYSAWGLEEDKIVVIENGLPLGDKVPLRKLGKNDSRSRFGYFGQINPYKGVNVILDAFTKLPYDVRGKVTLDIFGSGLENQTQEYQDEIHELLEKHKKLVRLHGPYEPEEMASLMTNIDWIVMGSVWWENSPLVIQEAFKFGRPIICPDIGGMAEKVKPGLGGLNYRARDSVSLAEVITDIVEEEVSFEDTLKNAPKYSDIKTCTRDHVNLYKKFMNAS